MDEVVSLIPQRLWVRFLLRHVLPQSMNMHVKLIRDSKMPQTAKFPRCGIIKIYSMISKNQQMS